MAIGIHNMHTSVANVSQEGWEFEENKMSFNNDENYWMAFMNHFLNTTFGSVIISPLMF